jgi:uncharacterized C2H2 Zn-finger protein
MCNDTINQHRSSKVSTTLGFSSFVLNVGRGHLYRHHRIFPCPRCKVLFESQEEVTLHLGKPEGCEFRESKQEDGVTSEMVERLRCKKKTRKGQSEEESWVEIYQYIFPGESVPSPCKSNLLFANLQVLRCHLIALGYPNIVIFSICITHTSCRF